MKITAEVNIKSIFLIKKKGLILECEIINGIIDTDSILVFKTIDQTLEKLIIDQEIITTVSGVKKGPMCFIKTDPNTDLAKLKKEIIIPQKAIVKK